MKDETQMKIRSAVYALLTVSASFALGYWYASAEIAHKVLTGLR
jgi:hypothetical protein